jgi:hypothetical protein
MDMREFSFRLPIGRVSFQSRVADDSFFCDVNWCRGLTFRKKLLLSYAAIQTSNTKSPNPSPVFGDLSLYLLGPGGSLAAGKVAGE